MVLPRKLLSVSLALIICTTSKAQLQGDCLSFKGYSEIGFGAFFNFSIPVSKANYFTGELGLDFFSTNAEQLVVAPVLAGYRYTLNGSGAGFYLEPNLGYCFAATDNKVFYLNDDYTDEKVKGVATGIGFGYLFESAGRIRFNLGLRYEHIFGNAGSNMFSFRISYPFIFGRRK